MRRLRYVDALRGIAILGVLLVHCGQSGSGDRFMPALFRTVVSQGQLGVQLFFVLSAFTLCISFRRSRAGTERRPFLNFFIRRFFRIAPLYYLGIGAYLWLEGRGPRYWLGDAPGISAGNIGANFLFLHGFSPYWINSLVPGGWAIAVEVLFYALFPLVALRVTDKRKAFNFFLGTVIVAFVLGVLLSKLPLIPHAELWGKYLKLYLPSQLPVFALGILMFFVVNEDAGPGERIAIPPLSLFCAASLLLAQTALGIRVLPVHVMVGVAFATVAIAFSRCQNNLFVNPVLVYLGKMSYCLYLVHIAVLRWLASFSGGDYLPVTGGSSAMVNYTVRLGLLLATSLAAASVLYALVEQPAQRVGNKLIAALEK